MNRKLLGFLVVSVSLLGETRPSQSAKEEFFETRIRPVLAQQCFACHTNSAMGGLQLDARGDDEGRPIGARVVAGDPDKSLLITALRQTSELKMPKGGGLTDAEIADFVTWVKDGAVWPVERGAPKVGSGCRVPEAQRKFWSLQPFASSVTRK